MKQDNQTAMSKENLLHEMALGWQEFQIYLDGLSLMQMNEPQDAAGWTVKDHVIHLARWEAGITALLQGRPRWEAMGISEAVWDEGFEAINSSMQQDNHDLPLIEVFAQFQDAHESLVQQLESMPEEAIMLPYHHYDTSSDAEKAVYHWIAGNTMEHYAEHKPWIAAIVAQD